MEIKILDLKSNIEKKKDFGKDKVNLKKLSELWLDHIMREAREHVMIVLMGMFKRLTVQDLEEVYSDACFVLWKKMNEKGWELKEDTLLSYIIKVCWNIGTHYLRKEKNEMVSLDELMDNRGEGKEMIEDDKINIHDIFQIIDEEETEEDVKYKRLDEVWKSLKEIDRLILECYYWEDLSMEEIARKVGYTNGKVAKSKKSKIIKKMVDMMKEEIKDDESPFFDE